MNMTRMTNAGTDIKSRINQLTGADRERSNAFRTELAAQLRESAMAPIEPKPISVRKLIEWAISKEHARVDFGEHARLCGQPLPGVGVEYIMMQRGPVGARVDGGGVSFPHDDAYLVADALENLARREVATYIAELARTGSAPDPMVDAQPKVRPLDWQENQHGMRPRTADATDLGPEGWKPFCRINRKGKTVYDRSRCTPVKIEPTVQQIANARRAWLDWWGGLLDVRLTLQTGMPLTRWVVTDEMPPMRPWRK